MAAGLANAPTGTRASLGHPSPTAGGSVRGYRHLEPPWATTSLESSQLPGPAVPHLDSPKGHEDTSPKTYSKILTAALFTIVQSCSSADAPRVSGSLGGACA